MNHHEETAMHSKKTRYIFVLYEVKDGVCRLPIKPFILPNDTSTPSVRPGYGLLNISHDQVDYSRYYMRLQIAMRQRKPKRALMNLATKLKANKTTEYYTMRNAPMNPTRYQVCQMYHFF